MEDDYKINDFIELLEYQECLKQEGKVLERENESKYLKLLTYSVRLSDQLHWERRGEYWELTKNFIELKITQKEFETQFNEIHGLTEKVVDAMMKDLKRLKTFSVNSKSDNFSKWSSEIFICGVYYDDPKELRAFLANQIMPELETYL